MTPCAVIDRSSRKRYREYFIQFQNMHWELLVVDQRFPFWSIAQNWQKRFCSFFGTKNHASQFHVPFSRISKPMQVEFIFTSPGDDMWEGYPQAMERDRKIFSPFHWSVGGLDALAHSCRQQVGSLMLEPCTADGTLRFPCGTWELIGIAACGNNVLTRPNTQ